MNEETKRTERPWTPGPWALDRLIGYADSPCGWCGEWNVPHVEMATAKAALAKAIGAQDA